MFCETGTNNLSPLCVSTLALVTDLIARRTKRELRARPRTSLANGVLFTRAVSRLLGRWAYRARSTYTRTHRLDEEGKGRRWRPGRRRREKSTHARLVPSNSSAHRAARTGIMIHNEASPRSPARRFRKSPRWRHSRPRLWLVPSACTIGTSRFSPLAGREARDGDWRCGGHYGVHMGVAGEITAPTSTRTPSGRPTTRRCSVYTWPGEARSFVARIRSVWYRRGYTRGRLEKILVRRVRAPYNCAFVILSDLPDSFTKSHYQTYCGDRMTWETSDISIIE